MLSNKKIDQVDSFTCVGSIISKDSGCSEDVKSGIAKAQGVFFRVEKGLEEQEVKFTDQDKKVK